MEYRILSRAVEFACFRRIAISWRNFVLAGKFTWNTASLFGRQIVSVSCRKYYIFGRIEWL